MLKYLTVLFYIFFSFFSKAQDNLLSMTDSLLQQSQKSQYASGTFKGLRIINGHSVETAGKNDLYFMISHRFGTINKGIYDFFGLDQATMRLGLEYGITDLLTIGVGRSSLQKTYDGFLKFKMLRQTEGNLRVPVTVVLFASGAMNTLRFNQDESWRKESSRFTYSYQVLIARKFSERFSFQISPTLIHRNFVETRQDQNDVYATGFGGRVKLTKRIALTGEYYYLFPGETAQNFKNSFSLGFDIETGGHVFQLIFTNSPGMIEQFFIPQTTASWSKREVFFGFNISRVFTLGKEEKSKKKY